MSAGNMRMQRLLRQPGESLLQPVEAVRPAGCLRPLWTKGQLARELPWTPNPPRSLCENLATNALVRPPRSKRYVVERGAAHRARDSPCRIGLVGEADAQPC